MTPSEAGVLLGMASAFDNRKVDETGVAAKAWAAALSSVRLVDAQAALIEHFKVGGEWLMPHHIVTGVKRLRTNRLIAYGTLPSPPLELDPDNVLEFNRWKGECYAAIADGEPERIRCAPAALSGPSPGEVRALVEGTAVGMGVER